MSATRRNGAAGKPPPSPPWTSDATTSNAVSSTLTASLPPAYMFLIVYPLTLILGSLFSLLDPSARAAPYSVLSQSHPTEAAPSYFAQKKNLFNLYFVKVGWFWITSSYAVFLATRSIRRMRITRGVAEGPTWAKAQGLIRWALVTVWWIAVTQWFFGPPIIDRGFKLTGGKCDALLNEGPKDAGDFVTAAACRVAGGAWVGGHDISGHVFLLVLGSAFLGMEALPVLMHSTESGNEEEDGTKGIAGWGVLFVAAVGGLSWWMLLMTAAYFHTWFEKVSRVSYTNDCTEF